MLRQSSAVGQHTHKSDAHLNKRVLILHLHTLHSSPLLEELFQIIPSGCLRLIVYNKKVAIWWDLLV